MISANDLRKYPNGEELVSKVNNGKLTLGEAAVLAVRASNPERVTVDILVNTINKIRGNTVDAKIDLTPEAKTLVDAVNKFRTK